MSKSLKVKNWAGFTLIEVIISIAILSGIVLIVSMFGLDVYDFGIFLGDSLSAQQEIQRTLKIMVSEIRSMNQSVLGSYVIESASQNSIIFYSDTDNDGLTDRIRYFLDGNIFKKGVIKPTGSPLSYTGPEKITEEVHDIYVPAGNIFAYYDSSYNGTGSTLSFPINISAVRLINISITVDRNSADATSRVNIKSSVNIRNIQ